MNSVNKDRRIHGLQWAGPPRLHLLDHPVSKGGDGVFGDASVIYISEMRAGGTTRLRGNLPGGQTLGIQRENHLIDIREPALALLDNLRLKGTFPIPRNLHIELATRVTQQCFCAFPVT